MTYLDKSSFLVLRRRAKIATPTSPPPSSVKVPGSGTGVSTGTGKLVVPWLSANEYPLPETVGALPTSDREIVTAVPITAGLYPGTVNVPFMTVPANCQVFDPTLVQEAEVKLPVKTTPLE